MLAPPALYIPRHCRGTPFERGRCRRDACTVMYISNAVAPPTSACGSNYLLSRFVTRSLSSNYLAKCSLPIGLRRAQEEVRKSLRVSEVAAN